MIYNNQLPDWKNEGVEPSDSLKENGFAVKQKPPANVFNWFWSLVIKAIKELQTKFGSHAENTSNPHSVTAEQVGLGKVNNTPDSEKNVAFASEAKVARKVKHAFVVRLNGGSTEGTNLWTYDGATDKSINLTPAKLGAADKVHTHSLDDVSETTEKKYSRVVEATSTDGITYTATVDGITELYNGMEITIIPNIVSASTGIKLNINGLGEVPIRRPLSFSTFVATSIDSNRLYFLSANTPCRLMYHANYTSGGIWLMADKVKTSAQDLYGAVPIENGGTGASTKSEARAKLNTAMAFPEPTLNGIKALSSEGYYFIKAVTASPDYGNLDLNLGVIYWNESVETVCSSLYKHYHIQFAVYADGSFHIWQQNSATGVTQEEITDRTTFFVAQIGNS